MRMAHGPDRPAIPSMYMQFRSFSHLRNLDSHGSLMLKNKSLKGLDLEVSFSFSLDAWIYANLFFDPRLGPVLPPLGIIQPPQNSLQTHLPPYPPQ